MNEVPGPGQQPAGNPRGWSSRKQRTRWIREAEAEAEARARRQEVSADRPVRVRLVWDAGISSPVTRELGQAGQDWFRSLVSPDPGARKLPDVQDADFALSAEGGFVVDSPGLPHVAVRKTAEAIYVLLGRAPRWADGAPPLVPAAPAPHDTPVRVRLVWDAGISSPVTRELGQAEQDWFRSLVSPDPGARKLPDVQDADFALSAEGGFVVDSPALPHIAVRKTAEAIYVLLVPAPPHPVSPVKKFRPFDEPGPGSPVRKPGSGFSPTA